MRNSTTGNSSTSGPPASTSWCPMSSPTPRSGPRKSPGSRPPTSANLARMFATTKGAAIYQGTCTQDQQANGTQTNRAIAILQTIVGGINVPGGWVLSPRLALKNIFLPTNGDSQPAGHRQVSPVL